MIESGSVPQFDLDLEKRVQDACLALADERLLSSAHDCSDGGLAVAIAEWCFSSLDRAAIGADIELEAGELSTEALLFGESPSRIIVSFKPENLDRVKELARDCPFEVIGKIGGSDLNIKIGAEAAINVPVAELENAWKTSLKNRLES